MAKKYYVWKDPNCGGQDIQWVELTSAEFRALLKQPENQSRRFIRLGNEVSNEEDTVFLEATEAQYIDWRIEKNAHNYRKRQQLFRCAKGTKFETVIMLAGYLGVREGEACGVQWKDVDFAKNTLYIHGSLKLHNNHYKELYYGETKTESSYRALPMPQPLAVYLRQLRTKQLEQRMLAGESYNRMWEDFVCIDALGNIVNPKYISRYFADLLKKYGLRKIRFHDLRHSCATLLLENGATLKQVQEWLGHHSYVVTADTYGHVLAETKRGMADTMSKILGEQQVI